MSKILKHKGEELGAKIVAAFAILGSLSVLIAVILYSLDVSYQKQYGWLILVPLVAIFGYIIYLVATSTEVDSSDFDTPC